MSNTTTEMKQAWFIAFVNKERMAEPLSNTYTPDVVEHLLDVLASEDISALTLQRQPSDSIPTLPSALGNIDLTCWQDGRFEECWHTTTYSEDSTVPLELVGDVYHVLLSPRGFIPSGNTPGPIEVSGVRYKPIEFKQEVVDLFAGASIPIPYVPDRPDWPPTGTDGCSSIDGSCIPPLLHRYLIEKIQELIPFT